MHTHHPEERTEDEAVDKVHLGPDDDEVDQEPAHAGERLEVHGPDPRNLPYAAGHSGRFKEHEDGRHRYEEEIEEDVGKAYGER